MIAALGLNLEFIDATKVRHGNYSEFDATAEDLVATVDSKIVYRAIPEYKTILREKLEEGSARYAILIRTCTRKFKAALKLSQGSYVLIVEVGGVKDYPTTDITQNIIKNIKIKVSHT